VNAEAESVPSSASIADPEYVITCPPEYSEPCGGDASVGMGSVLLTTVSVALLLVAVPEPFVTTQRNWLPLSASYGHSVPLPLVAQWRCPGRDHTEGSRFTHRDGDAGGVLCNRGRLAATECHARHEAGRRPKRAARQVVKAAIVANLNIDRRSDARRERGCGQRRRWAAHIDSVDPAATVVSEEVVTDVLARKLRRDWIVEGPAGDGASSGGSGVVLIGVQG
jgi:hypothetical protein